MTRFGGMGAALAAMTLLASGGPMARPAVQAGSPQAAARLVTVTVQTGTGPRTFHVELARSAEAQERGLMFRTNIPADGGMLFAPYPGDGGPPREASFWMKNTPSALDILFIRPNGTIATIFAHAEPFSEQTLKSGEPVSAVLEINAGKAAELGIAAGDKVSWPGRRR